MNEFVEYVLSMDLAYLIYFHNVVPNYDNDVGSFDFYAYAGFS